MASPLLQQLLQENPGETLWIADENGKALLSQGFAFSGDLLSNRWDIARLAEGRVRRAHFNDFRLLEMDRRYRRILYPVSKEKAAVHHLINSAHQALAPGGELILLGEKNSGIKTYAAKAAQRFAGEKNLRKVASEYLSALRLSAEGKLGEPLDDSDYTQLRPLELLGGLYSKPGQFGWNKIDAGSALLAQQFVQFPPPDNARVLDLGCGYGYLSVQLNKLGRFQFTATDNNAAALLSCAENFRAQEIEGRVIPSDAGEELEAGSADYLICNPPFHQGFQVEGDLTERFLQQAAQLLKTGGQALFVVNEFIPLGRKAADWFGGVKLLAKERGFCVYLLQP